MAKEFSFADLNKEKVTNFIENIEYLNLSKEALKQRDTVSTIPKKLHIIWVGRVEIPQSVIDSKNKWSELMPHWDITLWTNDNLTEEYFDKESLDFILSASKAVHQADIMRVYIIKKYGGFYVDADVNPIRPLDDLLYIDNDIILCNDYPTNWAYIATSFFGAVPNHPVLQIMSDAILNADLSSKEIHMHTGPRLFGKCVFSNDWGGKYPAFLDPCAMYQTTSVIAMEFIEISKKIYKLKKSKDKLGSLKEKYNELISKVRNPNGEPGSLAKHVIDPLRFGEHLYSKLWEADSLIYNK